MSDYLVLTKPRIIVLLTITGIGGFFVPMPNFDSPTGNSILLDLFVFIFIGYASAGGAMAVNNYIDRDIDALMERTKNRPSVGEDALSRNQILSFGFTLAILGILIGYFYFNYVTALFLAWGVIFYLVGYTLYLKRKSIFNTILGGLASPAPVWAGYAARMNGMAGDGWLIPIEGWLLGGLVFIWTPSHTWALSAKNIEDYTKAAIPMLPVRLGMEKTGLITLIAGIITLIYGSWLTIYLVGGNLIFVSLIIPHLIFVYGLIHFYRTPTVAAAARCFKIHNFWLAIVFGTLVLFLWVN